MSKSNGTGANRLRREQPVWAVAAYFDFGGTKRRLAVYRAFRQRLGVPLVAVELSFGQPFDLQPDDADILIQIRGGAVLWQKERLLNLALQALPPHVEAVAWLDSDVVFTNPDWPRNLLRELEHSELVQPFGRLAYLRPGEHPEDYSPDRTDMFVSAASLFQKGCFPEQAFRVHGLSQRIHYAPGMAWAARRSVLDKTGLYDAAILGGADKLMFGAACGRWEEVVASFDVGPAAGRHFLDWARPFGDAVGGKVSALNGDLLHLWHGEVATRIYIERFEGFGKFNFDPAADVAHGREGAWVWNSDRPEMHAFVETQLARVNAEPEGAPLTPVSAPANV